MFLKSLVLTGFKSFAEKTSLAFEPGISVVVGPNGSGKSNLVDAICWVLGEQGPAALRGGRMEDVIFAGSGKKAALGMAEVQLTIDNSAGLLPVEFSEVSICRTLFRSGDSEYRINGASCRLLDIQELLSDAGVGREQHIIVGQGSLDEVLGADPHQMRMIIEEAAGVGKHRRRKERALRKIASAEANIAHLGDVLAEIRRQLNPLRKQAEVAERHDLLQLQLRQVRLLLDVRRLREVSSLLETFDIDLESSVEIQEEVVSRLAAELAEFEAKRSEVQALAARWREVEWRLKASSERLAALKRLAGERVRALKAELVSSSRAAGEGQITELARQIDEIRAALVAAAEAETTQSEALALAHQELDRARAECASARTALVEQRDVHGRLSTEVDRLTSELGSAEAHSRSIEVELAGYEEQYRNDSERVTELRQRHAASNDTVRDLTAQQELLAQKTVAAQELVTRLEERRSALVGEMGEADLQIALARARSEVTSRDGSPERRRSLLTQFQGRVSLLGSLINLEGHRRRALESFIGPLDAVLVASDRAASAEVVASDESGEPLVALVAEGSEVVVEGVEPLLPASAGTEKTAVRALTDVYLVPSIEEAIRLAGQHRHAIFLTADGAVAVGSLIFRRPAGAVLSLEKLEGRRSALASSLLDVEEALRSARVEMDQLRESTAQLHAKLAVEVERARLEELEAESISTKVEQAREATLLADHSLSALSERLQVLEDRLREAEAAKGASERELERLEDEYAAAEEAVGHAVSVWDTSRMASAQATERRVMLEESLEALDRRMSLATRLLQDVSDNTAALNRAMERASWVARTADCCRDSVDLWTSEAGAAYRATLDLVAQAEDRLSELRSRQRSEASHLEDLKERAAEENMARNEIKVRRRILEAGVREDWQVEPDQILSMFEAPPDESPMPLPPPLAELSQGLDVFAGLNEVDLEAAKARLERQLAGVGSVNPLAAAEAEALGQREEFLSSQIEDVRASRRDLLKVVESVDERIEDLFASAYADVSVEFERLFQILFPLGRGSLRLTDQDMLHSGVEVEAGPAGRKLRRLSLLSGGERALSALALLFAIFRARPSPFYILDEVEAALDDVNLHRFLGLLTEFGESSQLLVVTHQKRTMEIADVLYGVTIRPDGVSKVLSERISELYPA